MPTRALYSSLVAGALSATFLLAAPGCGGQSLPSEANVYYDPALRPGVVRAANDGERQLLRRLSSMPVGQQLQLGQQGFVVDAAYHSASGRRCRSIRIRRGSGEQGRLACESEDGWVFVPGIFGGEEGL